MPRIVVGLSGGVDSFVTALLLQQQGYEVVGVNLQLWPARNKRYDGELRELCNRRGITLHHVDGTARFRQQVVEPFIRGYLSGITPNPCSVCNSFIKWDLLMEFADAAGVETIATGHYVCVSEWGGHFYVNKGADPVKDQSYFLWGVRENILRRAVTPLGEYTKKEVKNIARECGFPGLSEKRESMSVCFLERGDYRDFIMRETAGRPVGQEGNITDANRQIVGQHSGLLNYTVGQKRGIPLKDGQPQYVARMNIATNELVVGSKEALYRKEFYAGGVHLIHPPEIYAEDIEVKVRGLGLNPDGYARMKRIDNDTLMIRLATPAWAPAPGQPVVFYRGKRVIGGGIIL